MVRPVTDDDIGLKVLREPPAETAQIIDIVAIHGIGAHPDDSWCKNVGTVASPRWVNWLDKDDMLPAVVPNARIMRYGYESQWFGEGAMRQKTSAVAQRMLLALTRNREVYILCKNNAIIANSDVCVQKFHFRPLIFIAHCFGGLVVLKALVDARHDANVWPGVFMSTIGLIFFGTPFRGAEGMNQVEMLEAARSEYQEDQVQTAVLKILEPGNEFLQELVDQFGKTRTLENKAQIACFYELKSSNVGKIVGKENRTRFVVSESSGCLDVSDATSKFSLSRTHFNMNKFGKPTEEDFEIVRGVIQKMASESHWAVLARSQSRVSDSKHSHVRHIALSRISGGQPVTDDESGPNVFREAPAEATQISTTLVSKAPQNNGKERGKVPKSVVTWSSAEDEKLLHIVQAMELTNWKHVARSFHRRSAYACEKRYEKLMSPRKNA